MYGFEILVLITLVFKINDKRPLGFDRLKNLIDFVVVKEAKVWGLLIFNELVSKISYIHYRKIVNYFLSKRNYF